MFEARTQQEPFDIAREHHRLATLGPSIGAVVSFTGLVRETPLCIEHYPRMAAKEMAGLLANAQDRWPLLGSIIIHRYGKLPVGAEIVLVLTASSHRAAAFSAAEFLMDWLKTRAPFWKQEEGRWVEARASDAEAAARWGVRG